MKRAILPLAVFALMLSPSFADDAWGIHETDSTTLAYTENAEGNVFGVLCYSDCYYVITLSLTCEIGNTYPVLASSDAGGQSHTIACLQELSSGWAYSFQDYNSVDSLARMGNNVSFAIPIADSRFRVERFSLKGNIAIIDRALRIAAKRVKRSTKSYEM